SDADAHRQPASSGRAVQSTAPTLRPCLAGASTPDQMRVLRTRLRDFRSYERAEAELGDGLTVVVGPNGAGKTNLLEGVYFALTGRSCRTANEREVVRIGGELTRAEVQVEGEDGAHLLEVGFKPGETKRLRVDGAPVERFGPE